VLNRDYHAAAIANVVWRRMIDRGELEAGALRSIYKSATFPSTAYGVAHDLRPELADKVAEAFRTFDWTGTRMLDEYRHGEGTRFIPVDYAKMWNEVRLIDAAMGVDYATTKPDKR
jgi:phosphonate transport system substrate-binding protein